MRVIGRLARINIIWHSTAADWRTPSMDVTIRILLFLALVGGIAQAVTTTSGNGFGAAALMLLFAAFFLMGIRYEHEHRPPGDDRRPGHTEEDEKS